MKINWMKVGLTAAGMLLTAAAGLVADKKNESAMKDEISKQVAKALAEKDN